MFHDFFLLNSVYWTFICNRGGNSFIIFDFFVHSKFSIAHDGLISLETKIEIVNPELSTTEERKGTPWDAVEDPENPGGVPGENTPMPQLVPLSFWGN